MSSPHYPQSNGRAEAAVKSMKKLIRTAWNGRFLDANKLCKSLQQYCNTPSRKDGRSPAQKLYGHPIQDTLPAHSKSFAPEWQHSTTDAMDQANSTLETAKQYYNSASHLLPEIGVGTNLAVQDPHTKLWDTYGIVTALGTPIDSTTSRHKGGAL